MDALKPFNSKKVTLTMRGGFFTKLAALAHGAPCVGSTAYDTPTYYKRAWLHWDKMAQLKLRNLTIPMSWFVNKL